MITSLTTGDIVDIFFEHCEPIFMAKIVHIPEFQGDCFQVIVKVNELIYVQQFAYMKQVII
jgi:hypothetical protein